ncbi:MAG: hypothetical protein PVSMB5_02780 [Ktedonobacteraceae bacterium]
MSLVNNDFEVWEERGGNADAVVVLVGVIRAAWCNLLTALVTGVMLAA